MTKIKRKLNPAAQLVQLGLMPENHIGPLPDVYAGQTLILNPEALLPQYRNAENLVWKASGGFGCDPGKMGTAVFAKNPVTEEEARWERFQFIAAYTGPALESKYEAPRQALEALIGQPVFFRSHNPLFVECNGHLKHADGAANCYTVIFRGGYVTFSRFHAIVEGHRTIVVRCNASR